MVNLPTKLRVGIPMLVVFDGVTTNVSSPNVRVVARDNFTLPPDRPFGALVGVSERICIEVHNLCSLTGSVNSA